MIEDRAHGRRHRRHHRFHHRHRWLDRAGHLAASAVQHHLRRRVFFWFGAAIGLSLLVAGGVGRLVSGDGRLPALLAAFAVLWIAAGAIAWRLTRPLLAIIHVAEAIGDGKLESRMHIGRHAGELGVLAGAINRMAERIEHQLGAQRELLAVVSHELRTPLGHMRILLDGARDRAAEPALVDELEREVAEIDGLVGQLLVSSRLDFGVLDRRPLDATAVARAALERAGLSATRLATDADGGELGFVGDPTLCARALANLLDNAARHGGGATRVAALREGGAIRFAVEDAGVGFAPDALPRAFERFRRGGAAGSLGLGLSLVERIAVAHGGAARAENLPGGGARVSFTVGAHAENPAGAGADSR